MAFFHAITGQVGWYGLGVAAVLAFKLLLSLPIRRPQAGKARGRHLFKREQHRPQLRVSAVITVYNEDAGTLRRCLDSLLAQSRKPDAITIVDDASRNRAAVDLAHRYGPLFHLIGVDYAIVEFEANQGKRHGLAAGFRRTWDADVYACIDSDTVLAPEAIVRSLASFASRRVHCVTGLILALNRGINLLTRLIDMRYVNAFLGERVAYSRFGSVLCACGSLALYRGWVVRKYLGDFLSQTWLGVPATFGDDRRLTYYCLMEGRAVINTTAIARTAVPERLSHYLRQQTRWTKSFIREGLLMLKTSPLRVCWWFNLLELATWVAFTSALMIGIAAIVVNPQWWVIFTSYLGYVCVAAWVRSLHYLRGAAQVPPLDRLLTFACAPLYTLMNLTLLIPLRLYALATMRNAAWGTRKHVEIGTESGTRHQPQDMSPGAPSPTASIVARTPQTSRSRRPPARPSRPRSGRKTERRHALGVLLGEAGEHPSDLGKVSPRSVDAAHQQ